ARRRLHRAAARAERPRAPRAVGDRVDVPCAAHRRPLHGDGDQRGFGADGDGRGRGEAGDQRRRGRRRQPRPAPLPLADDRRPRGAPALAADPRRGVRLAGRRPARQRGAAPPQSGGPLRAGDPDHPHRGDPREPGPGAARGLRRAHRHLDGARGRPLRPPARLRRGRRGGLTGVRPSDETPRQITPRVAEIPPSLLRAINARKRPGDIDLGLGEPTLRPEVAPFEAALERVRREGLPYNPNPGLPALREAIARHHAYPGLGDAANVCVTIGSEEALYLAIKAVLDPARDEALIVEPCYLAYPKLCALEGIRHRSVAFDAADGFRPGGA